ncbi:protein SCAI [Exaiptasia diaphana]|uniref:Protein SCAI n=1 Tax=Exaiptasia diaphana TaxID=2652724 RepID=A0A913XA61_EXADI|nr:protein SCAI [Exaiptasia diaphana]KXJ13660.1 Protein SCAI [Exaiptasia diaphana]
MADEVNNVLDERKVVSEFCRLLEKSRLLFNSLRDLPQFGSKHWQTHFGRTFDVYTRLWKFQQQHRNILDEKYSLKRWQIGEIASKIGQLYYHYYLRTSEANYLKESFSFYSAIRERAYYSQASREEKPDLMVKKLRYYARYTVVCLLLNKMELVKDIIAELIHYVEEYVNVYDAEDDEEWRLVITEVTSFVQADNIVAVMTPDVIPVILSHRIKANEIPSLRGPTNISSGSNLTLQEIIIIGNCEKQVKFSELTLDMFRMLQAFEREPDIDSPRTLVTPSTDNTLQDKVPSKDSSKPCPNPHKYLLYKPTFSQLHVFLSVSFKEIPSSGVLLVYISGDAYTPSVKSGLEGQYDQGGVLTANRKTDLDDNLSKRRNVFKEPNCLYPEDLVPFTRKPLVLIVDCPNSEAFKYFPNHFGQPLVCLMSSAAVPVAMSESNRKGNMFTMFLYSPLVAFCYVSSIANLRSDLWEDGQRQVRRILNDLLRVIQDWSRVVDLSVLKILEDDFLKMMLLRYIFCFYVTHLHRAFKGSEYYPKCFPKLPNEILLNGGVEKQVLELASMLDVRSLFYEVGEAPPFD